MHTQLNVASDQSTRSTARWRLSAPSQLWSRSFLLLLATASAALAQTDPWTASANALKTAFTGPLATALILVATVIAGLVFAFGEGQGKKAISGLVFGGGMAMGAVRFVGWLFP